jgi:hypothetical protein
MGDHGLDRSGLGVGQVAGCCDCGNEHSGPTKCREFPDHLKTSSMEFVRMSVGQ